jgi:hypothetical protein
MMNQDKCTFSTVEYIYIISWLIKCSFIDFNMHRSNKRAKVVHKKGDVIFESGTNIKRGFDGNKWRRLCTIDKCERVAQVEGFCMRHFRKNDNQPLLSQTMKSSDEFSTIDFVMISHDQNDSINHVSEDPKKNILLDHSKFCLVERIKTIFLCIIISLDNESKVELIEQNLTSDSTQADPVSSEGNMLSTDRMNISTSSITFM